MVAAVTAALFRYNIGLVKTGLIIILGIVDNNHDLIQHIHGRTEFSLVRCPYIGIDTIW